MAEKDAGNPVDGLDDLRQRLDKTKELKTDGHQIKEKQAGGATSIGTKILKQGNRAHCRYTPCFMAS